MKKLDIMLKTLILVTLVVGTLTTLVVSAKVVVTSAKLMVLRGNAQLYNDIAYKTDEDTEEYLENDAKRQEIYNSNDTIVRMFSNCHITVKLLLLVVAIGSFVLLGIMWTALGLRIYYNHNKKRIEI